MGRRKLDRKSLQCYNCQKFSHFARECKSKKVPRNFDETQLAQDEDFDFDKVLLMATTNTEN